MIEFVIDSGPLDVIANPATKPPVPYCVVLSCATPAPPVTRLPATVTPLRTSDPVPSLSAPTDIDAGAPSVAFVPTGFAPVTTRLFNVSDVAAPITIACPVWRIVLAWAPLLPVPVIVIGTVVMSCVLASVYVPAAS